MAIEETPQRDLEAPVQASDPRRTMRAPFPKRRDEARDLRQLTERARQELNGRRLPGGSRD